MRHLRNSRGDTIIEVLIAIALMSVVLTSSYAISNRSSGSVKQAQEHTEALSIARTQIEQLKYLAAGSTSDIFTHAAAVGAGFCTLNSGADITILDDTDPNCVVNNGIDYSISISRLDNVQQHVFTVHVIWDSIKTSGKDTETLVYSLDQ